MSNVLPDCMMPDGADPCAGYQHLAARVRELEATIIRRNRDHNTLLADGAKWQSCAERAEAERDAFKRNDDMLTALVGKIGAERDALRAELRGAMAIIEREGNRNDELNRMRAERDALRALLARWRRCFAHLRPLIDSTLEQDTDAALAGEKA